jgi:hypothetical protein
MSAQIGMLSLVEIGTCCELEVTAVMRSTPHEGQSYSLRAIELAPTYLFDPLVRTILTMGDRYPDHCARPGTTDTWFKWNERPRAHERNHHRDK